MAGTKEAVITRLMAIAEDTTGVVRVTRNDPVVGEGAGDRPLIQIFDGDEVANEGDPVASRRLGQARRASISPEIYVSVGAAPETVATTLNTITDAFVDAVRADSALQTALGTTGSIQWDGNFSTFARGRTMAGEMLVKFTFNYVRP